MLKIAVIGGGSHSRASHLPALKRYLELHPGEVELAAFCDRQHEIAEGVFREYGFTHFYTSLEEMLGAGPWDGCIAVTPIQATASVATRLILAGIPLLMEKPPGATVEETAQLCSLAEYHHARVMVSMNRRFDSAIMTARSWISQRPVQYLRATMLRHNRKEAGFLTATGIHCLDAVRSLAGNIRNYSARTRQVDGGWWYSIDLEFENNATGVVEVMPTCGSSAESYEMFGAGYRVLAQASAVEGGIFIAWENEQIVRQEDCMEGMPPFVKDGTYAETVEFLSALMEKREPHPTLTEVRQSGEICHRIEQALHEKTP